jgi:hypothetical protein
MAGRPKKKINKKTFEGLCGIQCTEEEICDVLEVTDKTLNKWCKETYGVNFSDIFKVKRGVGRVSLRRTQWKLAEKNVAMAIWLGKQFLGQKEPDRNDNLNLKGGCIICDGEDELEE